MIENHELDHLIGTLKPDELAILKWHLQRRPEQCPPDPLPFIWLLLAGRGAGKTLTAANHIFEMARGLPHTRENRIVRVGLVGNTFDDVKKTMVEGSALALDTRVPTPTGMTTMGELKDGDIVIGGDGQPCNVLSAWDVLYDRPCYEITFGGGIKVVADANHRWLVESHYARSAQRRFGRGVMPQVLTTEAIIPKLKLKNGQANFGIRITTIDAEEVSLPLDPYLFGIWLGDGKSNDAEVTTADPEIVQAFDDAGFNSRYYGGYQYNFIGLYKVLREMSALTTKNKKTVPEVYFQGSYKQRLALLQGLMDTDGSVSERGQCEFSNNNLILHDAVIRLAGSLGIKANGTKKKQEEGVLRKFPGDRFYAVSEGWVTKFATTVPVFRLPRKVDRIPISCKEDEYWYIRDITPVKSVPVRCITVDSPDQTYLITNHHIRTHNTGLLSIIPEELIAKWNRTIGELIVVIPGHDENEHREIHFSSYTAQVPEKLRGPQFHMAWIDEPAKFEDADMNPMDRGTTWSNLVLGLRLGPQPHLIVSGTPTPCKLILYMLAHADCVVTRMTTWSNKDNLPKHYLDELNRLDPNSRTYRQEIMGEVLLDNPDALFSDENINRDRAPAPTSPDVPFYKVLGYDPSASSSDEADEAGIILVGYTPEVKARAKQNDTGGGRPMIEQHTEAYVLKDLSGHMTPAEQSALVIRTVIEEKVSDLIFETNQGADQVVTLLTQAMKDLTVDFTIRQRRKRKNTDFGPVKRFDATVTLEDGSTHKFLLSGITAMKNKKVRAETASYQYDYGRVHHPPVGTLPVCKKDACRTSLEYELTTWNPNKTSGRYLSPNRLDALVYALFFVFGRHAMHANANSKLHMPAPNRAGLRDDQKITALDRRRRQAIATIWSVDLGGGLGGGRSDGRIDPDMFNNPLARDLI